MQERKLKGKRYNDIAILAELDSTRKFQYKNQNDFIKKFRSLKTYFPLSYKNLLLIKNIKPYSKNKYMKVNFKDNK